MILEEYAGKDRLLPVAFESGADVHYRVEATLYFAAQRWCWIGPAGHAHALLRSFASTAAAEAFWRAGGGAAGELAAASAEGLLVLALPRSALRSCSSWNTVHMLVRRCLSCFGSRSTVEKRS